MNLFAVPTVSVTKRNQDLEPKVIVTPTAGILRINEAASKFMDVKMGEHVLFLNNDDTVLKAIADKNEDILAWAEENNKPVAEFPRSFWVVKGWLELDDDGEVVMVKERLTPQERKDGKVAEMVESFVGSKMASHKGRKGYGTLSCSSTTNWALLGGVKGQSKSFELDLTGFDYNIDGEERTMYALKSEAIIEEVEAEENDGMLGMGDE